MSTHATATCEARRQTITLADILMPDSKKAGSEARVARLPMQTLPNHGSLVESPPCATLLREQVVPQLRHPLRNTSAQHTVSEPNLTFLRGRAHLNVGAGAYDEEAGREHSMHRVDVGHERAAARARATQAAARVASSGSARQCEGHVWRRSARAPSTGRRALPRSPRCSRLVEPGHAVSARSLGHRAPLAKTGIAALINTA